MTEYQDEDAERLKAVGALLRRKRKQRNLTQQKVAERMHCSRNYLGQVERGLRNTSLLFLMRVAEAMGLTISELLSENE